MIPAWIDNLATWIGSFILTVITLAFGVVFLWGLYETGRNLLGRMKLKEVWRRHVIAEYPEPEPGEMLPRAAMKEIADELERQPPLSARHPPLGVVQDGDVLDSWESEQLWTDVMKDRVDEDPEL